MDGTSDESFLKSSIFAGFDANGINSTASLNAADRRLLVASNKVVFLSLIIFGYSLSLRDFPCFDFEGEEESFFDVVGVTFCCSALDLPDRNQFFNACTLRMSAWQLFI